MPPLRRRVLPLLIALLSSVMAPAVAGQGPYVVGGKDDPSKKSVDDDSTRWLGVEPVADFRYADRFAVDSVTVVGDGSVVLAIGRVGRQGPKAWAVPSGRGETLPAMVGSYSAAALDEAGEQIAVVEVADVMTGGEPGVRGVDLRTGEQSRLIPEASGCRAMAWATDSRRLACAVAEDILILDLVKGRVAETIPAGGTADALRWDGPETIRARLDGGAVIVRIDVASGREIDRQKGLRADGPAAFSPDGTVIAWGAEGAVELAPLGEGTTQRVPVDGKVTSLAWSADGRTLVVGSGTGAVFVFRVTGAEAMAPAAAKPSKPPRAATADRPARTPADERVERRSAAAPKERRTEDQSAGGRQKPARLEDRDLNLGREEEPAFRDEDNRAGAAGKKKENEPELKVEAAYDIAIMEQLGGDPRTADRMEAVVTKSARGLQGCFNRALKQGGPAAGELVYDLGVTPDGEGVSIEDPASDTVGNPKLAGCVAEKLREPIFGPGLGSMDIRLSITLTVVEEGK